MLYSILYYIALYAGLLPALLYFVHKKQKLCTEAIFPFLLLTALATLYEQIGTEWLQLNTSYWTQVYSLLEFVTIFYFYISSLDKKYKIYFNVYRIVFILFYIYSFSYWSEQNALLAKTINKTVISLLVFTATFLWFKQLFEKVEIKNLWQSADFYFVSGLFIYYASTFCLFILSSFLLETTSYFYDYWMINVVATLFLRALLSFGVWKMDKV